MKKNVIVLMGMFLLFSMSFIFAEINRDTVIKEVEISDEALILKSDNLEEQLYVGYEVEFITVKPIFYENIDLSQIQVTINNVEVLKPVLENDSWTYDEVIVPLVIGANNFEMKVIENLDGSENVFVYEYQITREGVLKDLDVYANDIRLELDPEFNSLITIYNNQIEMPEMMVFDFELANLLDETLYRVVISNDQNETIIEQVTLELLEVDDYLIESFSYGKNTVSFRVETYEDVTVDDNVSKQWVELALYEFNFLIDPIDHINLFSVRDSELNDPKTLVDLTPSFEHNQFNYVGLVNRDVSSIDIVAVLLEELTTNDIVEVKINDVVYASSDVRNITFLDEALTVELEVQINGEIFLYHFDLFKKGYLEKLNLYYANENNSLIKLKMTPSFNQTDQPYEVVVPAIVSELLLLSEFTNNVSDDNLFVNGVIYEEFHKIEIPFGESTMLVELKNDNVVVESYEITMIRPKNLMGLELTEIGEFGFDPNQYHYNIDVSEEIDVVTVIPTRLVKEKVYINGTLLETTSKNITLEFGKNVLEVAVVYDDISLMYTLVINRDGLIETDKPHNNYRYHYADLDIQKHDDQFNFGPHAMDHITESFKWGNNKNNEIIIEVSEDEGEINIPYQIYKFMTQRKVTLLIEYDNETYAIDLSKVKLNRYIKGSQNVGSIQVEFEIDDNDFEYETEIKFLSDKNEYNREHDDDDYDEHDRDDDDHDDDDYDDHDRDDDDHDDDDYDKHNKSNSKSNGHNH